MRGVQSTSSSTVPHWCDAGCWSEGSGEGLVADLHISSSRALADLHIGRLMVFVYIIRLRSVHNIVFLQVLQCIIFLHTFSIHLMHSKHNSHNRSPMHWKKPTSTEGGNLLHSTTYSNANLIQKHIHRNTQNNI
jgi:hypothetical protein